MGAVADVRFESGPDRVSHYNVYLAADINSQGRTGVSSGQATAAMERVLKDTLPNGFGYEWTDLTFQQKSAGNTALMVFPICVMLVFLILSAQYESWALPLAVILIVPMCLLSAMVGRMAQGIGQQRADADRLHRAGRAGVQKRDPDSRVRARAGRARAALPWMPRSKPAGCVCGPFS